MDPIHVRIRNFQSIDDIEFDVHGFTTITGKTNIGKSAIIRAISGSILNIPVTNLIRNNEKFCTVELSTEGWKFKWEKGEKGINRYYINGSDKPLDSVGRGQIEEIRDLGFGSIKIGENKCLTPWYADQYESIFLLNESGPTVTDFMSEVSRLNVLQSAIVYSNREKKRQTDKAKFLEEEIESLREKKSKFLRLEEIKNVRNELKLQRDSILSYEEKVDRVEALDNSLKTVSKRVSRIERANSCKIPDVIDDSELQNLKKIYIISSHLESKASSIKSIRNVDKVVLPEVIDDNDLNQLKKLFSFSKKREKLETAIQLLETPISLPESLGEFPSALAKGCAWINGINRLEKEIKDLEIKENSLHQKILSVDEELKKIPKCEMCGRPTSESTAHSHEFNIELD